eukprot:3128289-Alexandrium_andersonii.AAC.1
MAFPARDISEAILKRTAVPTRQEDNLACVTVAAAGNNPTMRHLERAQNCSVMRPRGQHDR